MRAAGIGFEIVPGVTSGIAAAAYAGIPATHRGHASAVALVTAHEDPVASESALDWAALAAFPGTLIFYMGVRQLETIAARLIAAGRRADEPAAVVERGTLPEQRVVHGTLETIAMRAAEAQIRAPAITVVGAVAALGLELGVGRPGAAAARRTDDRGHAGAGPVERSRRPAAGARGRGARDADDPDRRARGRAARRSRDFDLICLTSPNGVGILFDRLADRGEDARVMAGGDGRGDRAGDGPGAGRARDPRGRRARAVHRRSRWRSRSRATCCAGR